MNLSSIKAIAIITASPVIIALDSASDRYPGISDSQYNWGFVWDILGSALHGLIFALSKARVCEDSRERRSFHVVLEQQAMVSFFALVFTTVGVLVAGVFKSMTTEATNFKHGEVSYIMVLVWSAITFQLGVLGGPTATLSGFQLFLQVSLM